MNRCRAIRVLVVLVLAGALAAVGSPASLSDLSAHSLSDPVRGGPGPATSTPAPTPTATPSPAPLPDQRFGVVLHSTSTGDNQYFLDALGVYWYLDFNPDMSQVPVGTNKVPFIPVPTDSSVWTSGQVGAIESLTDPEIAALGFLTRAQLAQMAQDSPGAYWYIFGEPNRYGHITGTRFAPVFRYLATSLKTGDLTAKIVSPSILNWDFTCIGCAGYQSGEVWLKEFIAAHESRYGQKPAVDAWAIDAYPIDWVNTPNNDPAKPAFYNGQSVLHSEIAIQQIVGLRQYLDTIPEYASTPIWVTEIAVHVGYDSWKFGPGFSLVPVGKYNWDHMSEYLVQVLDWLKANASANKVERWFFYRSWRDIVNVGSDGYMGIIFFDGPQRGATLNCLGDTYRSRSLVSLRLKCDASGNTVTEGGGPIPTPTPAPTPVPTPVPSITPGGLVSAGALVAILFALRTRWRARRNVI